MGSLQGQQKINLRNEERRWIAHKDWECSKTENEEQQLCLLDQTRDQTKFLESHTKGNPANIAKNCGEVPAPDGLIGIPYKQAKEILRRAGYLNISKPYPAALLNPQAFEIGAVGEDPAECGNAGCSVPFTSTKGEILTISAVSEEETDDMDVTN